MNSISNIVYDIQTMSTQSGKQCPNLNAGLQHRSHSNITLGIVGEPTVKKR